MNTVIPTSVTRIVPANNSRFIDVALNARAEGCDLYSNGKSIIASPVRMPGWFKVGVSLKAA